jgi:hypothetical protein
MPYRVGPHFVRGHDRFVRADDQPPHERTVCRLTAATIDRIVAHCAKAGPVTMKQHYLNTMGTVPPGASDQHLSESIYEYNPKSHPPMDSGDVDELAQQRSPKRNCFSAARIEINGQPYALDMNALSKTEMEPHPDVDLDELFAV